MLTSRTHNAQAGALTTDTPSTLIKLEKKEGDLSFLGKSGNKYTPSLMTSQEKEDYFKFFTTEEGVDILPYVYKQSSDAYDQLVKNCPEYYIFHDEVNIIKNRRDIFKKYLSGIREIIEIGPGSDHAITHKTLPILSYANDVQSYHIIDNSAEYLAEAHNFVKNNTSKIDIYSLKADLFSNLDIKIKQKYNGPKCVLSFGITLGNFLVSDQSHIIGQIKKMTDRNDLLIMSVDTNHEVRSLLSAYSGKYNYELVRGALEYFAKINPSFLPHINSFAMKCVWNSCLNAVETYFVAKDNLLFSLDNFGPIKISNGQKLKGIRSHKHRVEVVQALLSQNGFETLEILSYSNADRIKTFICRKI
ncbi:MAG: L-histidine N(alpha)-methyltransferase [Pseudomonadota bacterium]